MDTGGLLYCIGCSGPGLPWWADSDALHAWRLGFTPILNPEPAGQHFTPATGDESERMSEADTVAWVRKRESVICDRLARQLSNECLDGTMMAGRIAGRKQPMEAPANPKKLGPKKRDLSQYLDAASALTERQRDCLSLRLEYGLGITEIARRLGIHHATVYEHIAAGKKVLDNDRFNSKPGKSRQPRYTTPSGEDDGQ